MNYYYAERECKDCHIVLPANAMVERSGTAVTGQSRSVSHPGNNSLDASRQIHTTTTHTRNFTYYLCGACDERRRRAVRRMILWFFGLGLALIVVLAVLGSRPQDDRLASPVSTSELTESASFDATEVSTSEEGSPSVDATEPLPVEAATPGPTLAETRDAVEQLWPEITAAIENDITHALDTGNQTAWEWHGMRGDVVVSAAQDTSSGPCRSFYVRLITAQEIHNSSNGIRCFSSTEDEWAAK